MNLKEHNKGPIIELYNALGQRVRTYDLSEISCSKISLSTDQIPSGVYFLKSKNREIARPLKVVITKGE